MIDEQFESFDSNCERHFLDQYFNEMKKGNFDDNYLFNCEYLLHKLDMSNICVIFYNATGSTFSDMEITI